MNARHRLRHHAILFLIVAGAASAVHAETLYRPGAPHVNPLLGHWHLSGAESNPAAPGAAAGCYADLVFEPDAIKLQIDGHTRTNAVSFYNVGTQDVFVIGSGANAVTYRLVDDRHIVLRSGLADCHYARQ